jgi:hypothetical protein
MKLGVKRDGAALTATFKCALGAAVTMTADANVYKMEPDEKDPKKMVSVGFDYNEDINVPAAETKFKLASDKWQIGADNQAWFNTKFSADWTADSKDDKNKTVEGVAGTLADWLETPWCYIDVNSLKFTSTSPSGYRAEDYYNAPVFFVEGAEFDAETNTFDQITGIGMTRKARTEGLPDFKSDVIGNFTFDIYDVWFHKKTVTVKVKINKPGNITSRQAR